MTQARVPLCISCALTAALTVVPAYATIIQTTSGFSSVGTPVSFMAELTISGDILTVKLSNTSPVASAAPNDVLSSYFFDIVNGEGARPTLTYVSAAGDVYLAHQSSADVLQTANASLKAVNAGDCTWEFRTFTASVSPFFGFGVGTVGNGNLTPNNFHGNIVDGMDYSIYAGDVTTRNLDNRLLVKDTATFVFSGLTGFAEADIKPKGAFGLGTAPDSLMPEPATLGLLALGGLLSLRRRRR